jgi:hypothetical protein
METRGQTEGPVHGQAAAPEVDGARLPYAPPRLDRLGAWSALTLQQSIPIFP